MAEVQYVVGFIIRGNMVKKRRWRKHGMRSGEGREVELNSSRGVFSQRLVTLGFLRKNEAP